MTLRSAALFALALAFVASAPACKKKESSGEAGGTETTTDPTDVAAAAGGAAEVAGAKGDKLDPTTTHEVSSSGPQSVTAGEEAPVSVSIKPLGGWKINTDDAFPTKVTVTAPEGVTVSAESLDKAAATSFDEKGAKFSFEATATEAGEYELECDVRFAVCSATSCIPKREKVTVALKAE